MSAHSSDLQGPVLTQQQARLREKMAKNLAKKRSQQARRQLFKILFFVSTTTFALAAPALPSQADQPSSAQLKLLELNLRDAVKPTWGFQGQSQGAGTPNSLGIGAFLPIAYGKNSITFLDVLANYNLADRTNYSSIAAADLFGGTISTSTRLGYRWLNGQRSWLYGFNAGYDSRPLTISASSGATASSSGFFQQVAVGAEAINNSFKFNATALVPVGATTQTLTNTYEATTLGSINLDATYAISHGFDATVGYYYQWGDWAEASGSGLKGRLAYAINNGLTAGVTVTYDNAFETRVSGDITYRFNTPKSSVPSAGNNDLIAALSRPLPNRDVRVVGRSIATTTTAAPALLVCNKIGNINLSRVEPLTAWDLTGFNSLVPHYYNLTTNSLLISVPAGYLCSI